jgi:hypothetical protein
MKFNKYIKTDDVKSKNDVNRFHFMKLKNEKKKFFSKEKFFFEMRAR